MAYPWVHDILNAIKKNSRGGGGVEFEDRKMIKE